MGEDQITRETLDLIAALRPFTGPRGRKLIDTLLDISQSIETTIGVMDIGALSEKARNLLSEKLDSALSLSLILAAAWLSQAVTKQAGSSKNGSG